MKDCLKKIADSYCAQRGMQEWCAHPYRNAALFVLLPILLAAPHTFLTLGVTATVGVFGYAITSTSGWWARCLST